MKFKAMAAAAAMLVGGLLSAAPAHASGNPHYTKCVWYHRQGWNPSHTYERCFHPLTSFSLRWR